MNQASRNALPRKVKQDGKCDLKSKSHDVISSSPKVSAQGKNQRAATSQPASEPGASTRPKTAIEATTSDTTPTTALPEEIPSSPHNKEDDVSTPEGIARYFKEATKGFELMIQRAVESLVEHIKLVETKLGAAIEYESRRVTEIEERNSHLERRMGELELTVEALRSEAVKHNFAINKSERFSRRNNIRIVGIPECTTSKEDCVAVVELIAK